MRTTGGSGCPSGHRHRPARRTALSTAQPIQKTLPVAVVAKDPTPLIAAVQHVVERVLLVDSQRSCHVLTLPRPRRVVERIIPKSGCDPASSPRFFPRFFPRMAKAFGKDCTPHMSGGGLGFLYMMHFVWPWPTPARITNSRALRRMCNSSARPRLCWLSMVESKSPPVPAWEWTSTLSSSRSINQCRHDAGRFGNQGTRCDIEDRHVVPRLIISYYPCLPLRSLRSRFQSVLHPPAGVRDRRIADAEIRGDLALSKRPSATTGRSRRRETAAPDFAWA